jgi:hypothetical protein
MIAGKDFTQEMSMKDLTGHAWPQNLRQRAVPRVLTLYFPRLLRHPQGGFDQAMVLRSG